MSAIISGFTNPLATQIKTRTIHRNHELYKMYTDLFPFLGTGDDENRLLAKTGVIQVSSRLKGDCPAFNFFFHCISGSFRYNAFGRNTTQTIPRITPTILPYIHSDMI